MFIDALKSREPSESGFLLHLAVPALQTLRFPMFQRRPSRNANNNQMDFHDSYLSPISLTLHRCSGAMNPMISRTWRLCVGQNINGSQWILTILRCTHVRPCNILLPPMVLPSFSSWHQNAIKVATRQDWQNCHGIHFVIYFQLYFHCFFINATRRRVGEVTKNATDLSQHEALKDAHVHETTVRVTFGARRFGTHFRVLTRCSTYAVI